MKYLPLFVLICANLAVGAESTCHGRQDASVCGHADTPVQQRIAAGFKVEQGQFPSYVWLVTMLFDEYTGDQSGMSLCGGTLIDNEFVITAAHCFPEPDAGQQPLTAVYSFSKALSLVARKCKSAKYSVESTDTKFSVINDLVVARLSKKLEFNHELRPACLPDRPVAFDDVLYTIGKGKSNPNELYSEILYGLRMKKTSCHPWEGHSSTVCVKDLKDRGAPCQGDSGGPLYAIRGGKQTLVGITSYGNPACLPGQNMEPTVFADVHNLRDEIANLRKECSV